MQGLSVSHLLPHPLLTAMLVAIWLLLTDWSLGQLLLGSVVALTASWTTHAFQPLRPKVRNWRPLPRLIGIVLIDVVRSNIAVARIVLRGRSAGHVSGFVMIPLSLRNPTGLAVLACIVTSTPGTAWIEYESASGRLLLHVLDLVSEEDWVNLIKGRYESLLLQMFE